MPTAITAVLSASTAIPTTVLAAIIPEVGITVAPGENITALVTDAPVIGNIVNNGKIAGGEQDGIEIGHELRGNLINNSGATISGSTVIDISATMYGSIINQSGATITGTTGIEVGEEGFLSLGAWESGNQHDFNVLVNNGLIEANSEPSETSAEVAQSHAISIQGPIFGDILNSNTGIIQSLSGDGIHISINENYSSEDPNATPGLMRGDIDNYGLIKGGAAGITLSSGGSSGHFVNGETGKIIGGQAGINIGGNGFDGVQNRGLIEGGSGITIDGNSDDSVKYYIENQGTILATSDEGVAIFSKNIIGSMFNEETGHHEEYKLGLTNLEGGLIENTAQGGTAILLEENAQIKGEFSNAGTIRGTFAIKDTTASNNLLQNSGRIEGKIDATTLTLNNTGTFQTEQGSTFASYQGNGEIIAVLSNSTTATEPVINVTGNALLEAGSKIWIEGKADDFTATVGGKEYLIVQANTLEIKDDELFIGSQTPLLEVKLTGMGNNQITALVKTNNPGEVISQIGATRADEAFLNSFVMRVIQHMSESDAAYRMFKTAESSPEALKKFAISLQPETSGSDVVAANAIQSAAFGSIAARTGSVRSGVNTGDIFQSGGSWTQLLHSKGLQDDTRNSQGFSSRISGITVGLDGELNTSWTAGVALTAARGTTNVKNSSDSTDTDNIIMTLYGSWQLAPWFADIMSSIGYTKNESKRLNKIIKSNYDADPYGLRLTLGRDIQLAMADILIQPTVAFNYGRVDIDSYKEKGSAAALAVKAQHYETVELGAGIKAIKSFDMDNDLLNLSVNLNGWHDFAADQIKTKSRFLVADSVFLTSTGEKPEKTTWQAEIGADYLIGNNMTFSANYDHLWRKGFKSNSVYVKFRYEF